MKLTHSTIWRMLRKGFKAIGVDANRHEDRVTIGVPDVSYGIDGVNGWIEIKSLRAWPKVTPRRIPDLTIHQVRWLENRGKAGGSCWILLVVGTDFILLSWSRARELYKKGLLPRRLLADDWATDQWSGRIKFDELLDSLAKGGGANADDHPET